MTRYCDQFMNVLFDVLFKNEYSTESKTHAMVAVGDICLSIEGDFSKYFERTMDCLMGAANITVNPSNFETED